MVMWYQSCRIVLLYRSENNYESFQKEFQNNYDVTEA